MRTAVKALLEQGITNQTYEVAGWVRSVRLSKGIAFIVINDGSNLAGIQVVAEQRLGGFEEISHLGTGSALRIAGNLVPSPAAGQERELLATEFTIEIGRAHV